MSRNPGSPRQRTTAKAARTCAAALAVACALSHAALPPPLTRAFLEADLPLSAVAIHVQEIGSRQPLISHQSALPMNPASTIKLLTTFAALDVLGPEFTWKTEAYALGTREGDLLEGNLLLRGTGDPKITIESFQQFVKAIRDTGLREIRGDLVLDRTLFAPTRHDPSEFDNEPNRPYNVGPDALLANFKHVRFTLVPDPAAKAVRIDAVPPLPGLTIVNQLQLAGRTCGDWKALAQGSFTSSADRAEAVFRGRYSPACGEQGWNVSVLDHAHYVHQMFQLYWRESGGTFAGGVRDGATPGGLQPLATLVSAPLADQVIDINKVSNNVMARQVFLTLASKRFAPPFDTGQANAVLRDWLASRKLRFPELVVENGSGLSRQERISAHSMGQLLLVAQASPRVPEFFASLPIAAVDGTMRKRLAHKPGAGYAYMKTGSLEGVRSIAGYLFDPEGRRYVVVCFVNHANVARANAPMDFLVQWLFANAAAWQRAPRSVQY